MRHITHAKCYGQTVFMTVQVEVRLRASYLGSRWVQAPISDRREPDT